MRGGVAHIRTASMLTQVLHTVFDTMNIKYIVFISIVLYR